MAAAESRFVVHEVDSGLMLRRLELEEPPELRPYLRLEDAEVTTVWG